MSLLDENATTELHQVPDPGPEAEKEDTEYVVLKLLPVEATSPGEAVVTNETWEKLGSGRGSRAAVLKAVVGQVPGVFCVTPARSWKPTRVEVETTVKVTEL